jgi:hypothetical protein
MSGLETTIHGLDTHTLGWQLIDYPADWTHQYLVYAARARLLRLRDGKVLWENRCFRKMPESVDGPAQVVFLPWVMAAVAVSWNRVEAGHDRSPRTGIAG